MALKRKRICITGGADMTMTRLVQLRQLGIRAEAGQDGLEPPELCLDFREKR